MSVVPPSPRSRTRGTVLLEVLIAVAILGSAGLALLSLLGAAERRQAADQREEQMFLDADRVMTAQSLLTRTDLDRRLGESQVGNFVVSTSRPEVGLYRVSLAERRAPDRPLLITLLFRSRGENQP